MDDHVEQNAEDEGSEDSLLQLVRRWMKAASERLNKINALQREMSELAG